MNDSLKLVDEFVYYQKEWINRIAAIIEDLEGRGQVATFPAIEGCLKDQGFVWAGDPFKEHLIISLASQKVAMIRAREQLEFLDEIAVLPPLYVDMLALLRQENPVVSEYVALGERIRQIQPVTLEPKVRQSGVT